MRDLQYLAVTGLLPYDPWLMELTRLAGHHDCHIIHMHANGQGELYNASLFIQGKWSAIAKMESALHGLQKKENLLLHFQRVTLPSSTKPEISYLLYLSTTEEASAIHKVLRFLAGEPLTLQDITTERYPSRHTQTPVTHATIRVYLSTQLSISEWRERFMLFCDELNIDAAMEPEKA